LRDDFAGFVGWASCSSTSFGTIILPSVLVTVKSLTISVLANIFSVLCAKELVVLFAVTKPAPKMAIAAII